MLFQQQNHKIAENWQLLFPIAQQKSVHQLRKKRGWILLEYKRSTHKRFSFQSKSIRRKN